MCSYPTYEEWKRVGNVFSAMLVFCVLILPMRNGNPSNTASISPKPVESSYPTYEEWKHSISASLCFSTIGSYPTYEEWKLRIA